MNGRKSLDCNAGFHDRCIITWCACECHTKPRRRPVTDTPPPHTTTREETFDHWWINTLVSGDDLEAAAHEAFCAGWEAALDLLGHDHYVIFTEDRWTVEHSVECKLSGRMHECEYHEAIADGAADYHARYGNGRWRLLLDEDGYTELMPAEDQP